MSEAPKKTGWPEPELAQDDCRALFRWFADRVGSRRLVRTAAAAIRRAAEGAIKP